MVPSGLQAATVSLTSSPGCRSSRSCAPVRAVPDDGPPVVAGGQEPLALRVEGQGDRSHRRGRPSSPGDRARRGVDQHGGAIGALAAEGQGLAVRGERDRPDPADPGRERSPDLPGRAEVPEATRSPAGPSGVARTDPSGLTAMVMSVSAPGATRTAARAGRRPPGPRRSRCGSRGVERAPVGAEAEAREPALATLERLAHLPGGDVPDDHPAVAATAWPGSSHRR